MLSPVGGGHAQPAMPVLIGTDQAKVPRFELRVQNQTWALMVALSPPTNSITLRPCLLCTSSQQDRVSWPQSSSWQSVWPQVFGNLVDTSHQPDLNAPPPCPGLENSSLQAPPPPRPGGQGHRFQPLGVKNSFTLQT